MGNVGIGGVLHSEIAPFVTRLIDKNAYGGRDVRREIRDGILKLGNPSVLDLCCGVGFGTMDVGIDSSPQMICKARRIHPLRKFRVADAEDVSFYYRFDVVTCFFSFHEMPPIAHDRILSNAVRLCSRHLIVVDISPEYESSPIMRSGEPYLLTYQDTIESTMLRHGLSRVDYIPGHVTLWIRSSDLSSERRLPSRCTSSEPRPPSPS